MAKIKSLTVRPCKSADLSFPVQGIIDDFANSLYLGAQLEKFDLSDYIDSLHEYNEDGTPKINLAQLIQDLKIGSVAMLRNNTLKYNVKQMESERAKQYLDWHKHAEEIANYFTETYNNTTENKVSVLESLYDTIDDMYKGLKSQYETDANTEVIKHTATKQKNISNSENDSFIASIRMQQKKHSVHAAVNPGGGHHHIPDISSVPQKFINGQWVDMQDEQPEFHSQKNKSSVEMNAEGQVSSGEYRHPYLMSQTQRHEYVSELLDRILNSKTIAKKAPDLKDIWSHDLEILNSELNKTQIALINTFLFIPFSGEITGIYKNPGEAVRAGEAVLRIENNDEIYLVGIIQHRGLLSVSSSDNVELKVIIDEGVEHTLNGRIVSIRGHESDDDVWDIILKFNNTIGLPNNYTLDNRNATINFI